jgi:hypothetical protein
VRHDVTAISSNEARLARVQHAALYGRISMTRHAVEEAENANAHARDIEHAIRTATRASGRGKVSRVSGGAGIDREDLVVVVREIQSGLLVITVF